MGSLHSVFGILVHRHLCRALRHLEDLVIGLVPFRARQPKLKAKHRRSVQPRVGDVVPIPDPHHDSFFPVLEFLTHREDVGQDLTRMQMISEPIDDGNAGVPRELFNVSVGKRADHDPVDIARQHACRVLDRLTAPELEVTARQKERRASELEHAGFK